MPFPILRFKLGYQFGAINTRIEPLWSWSSLR